MHFLFRCSPNPWLSCEGDTVEKMRLHRRVVDAADELAGFVSLSVQGALGELDDWSHD
ncbi:hypothetical protein [Pseudomonas putida]|uniref:hypothetical protein n=1 Tax=Pseudomonas putida TaxID=303 RepID=UPI002449841C|nr:hypothetical protein [Pseudomonas putida]MDG9815841.1 hypothetical protein [Pseudomonas putida]